MSVYTNTGTGTLTVTLSHAPKMVAIELDCTDPTQTLTVMQRKRNGTEFKSMGVDSDNTIRVEDSETFYTIGTAELQFEPSVTGAEYTVRVYPA